MVNLEEQIKEHWCQVCKDYDVNISCNKCKGKTFLDKEHWSLHPKFEVKKECNNCRWDYHVNEKINSGCYEKNKDYKCIDIGKPFEFKLWEARSCGFCKHLEERGMTLNDIPHKFVCYNRANWGDSHNYWGFYSLKEAKKCIVDCTHFENTVEEVKKEAKETTCRDCEKFNGHHKDCKNRGNVANNLELMCISFKEKTKEVQEKLIHPKQPIRNDFTTKCMGCSSFGGDYKCNKFKKYIYNSKTYERWCKFGVECQHFFKKEQYLQGQAALEYDPLSIGSAPYIIEEQAWDSTDTTITDHLAFSGGLTYSTPTMEVNNKNADPKLTSWYPNKEIPCRNCNHKFNMNDGTCFTCVDGSNKNKYNNKKTKTNEVSKMEEVKKEKKKLKDLTLKEIEEETERIINDRGKKNIFYSENITNDIFEGEGIRKEYLKFLKNIKEHRKDGYGTCGILTKENRKIIKKLYWDVGFKINKTLVNKLEDIELYKKCIKALEIVLKYQEVYLKEKATSKLCRIAPNCYEILSEKVEKKKKPKRCPVCDTKVRKKALFCYFCAGRL